MNMVKDRSIVFVSDLIALLAAFLAAQLCCARTLEGVFTPASLTHLLLLYVAYAPAYAFYIVRTPLFKRDFLKNLKITAIIWCLISMILAFLLYTLRFGEGVNRSYVFCLLVFCFLFILAGRVLISDLSRRYYAKPEKRKRIVIFANDSNVMKMLYKLTNARLLDYDIVGIILYREGSGQHSTYYRVDRYQRSKLYGKTYLEDGKQQILDFLKKEAIDEALLSLPDTENKAIHDLLLLLESMGIDASLTMNSFGLGLEASRIEQLGPYHVLTFSPRIFETQELFLKRLLDIAGGLAGCVLCLFVGLFVAPAIYMEDPGPVIFKQKRVGRNGRVFDIYKFRSMYQDAEARKQELMQQNEMNGLMFKMKNDPRITKVGKFIRKTSLDEFPQFFNVLKGDMSLIGTRPPTVAEFNEYSAHHKRRLSLKPGITGLWQVSGRSDITDFEDVVKLDTEYIDHWSFFWDIRILFKTVWVVLTGKGSS